MPPTLKVNDFVVALHDLSNVERSSVGQVLSIMDDVARIYFIGANTTITTRADNVAFLDLSKTGKPYPQKICNICHKLKDNDEFDVNQTDAQGRKTTRPSCRECRVDIDGTHLLTTERRRMQANKPAGIFTCPICGKTSIIGVTANIVIDHNHSTGRARKWICDSCNTGLGRFKDDISLLRKVIKYLEDN